jgi:hypothetical protein
VFELFLEEEGDEESGEEGETTEEEAVGAPMTLVLVWPPTPLAVTEDVLSVEGTINTPASISGRSPTICAVVSFQRFTLVISWRAQCGTRVPAGTGLGNAEGVSVFVQLNEYWDQVIHACPWHPSQALKRL